jgi:glycosyltransferase involved in cell wall biosynthesis
LKTISIIIPAMNEESGIGITIDELPTAELAKRGYLTEVLVVDGNSKDNTVAVARSKGATTIIEPRKGYGRAYKTGFQEAKGDYIATLDADGTYPAEMIPDLLDDLVANNLDFITTNRFGELKPGAMTFSHRIGNKVLSSVAQILFRAKFSDSQSGMWVFKKSLLHIVGVHSDGMGFSQELKIRAFQNGVCKEVPIYYKPRIGEVKLSTLGDGYANLKEMIGLVQKPLADPLVIPARFPEVSSNRTVSPPRVVASAPISNTNS